MLRPLAITTLLVAAACGVAQADVYRWVDEHGEAHYSDRWMPGSELIKSSRPHPVVPDSSTEGPAAASPGQAKANGTAPNKDPMAKLRHEAAEQAVKQDVAKVREAQCKQAKERYQKAIEARRIYKAPKEGDTDRVFMTDQETDAYRLQARNDVTTACGSPPPAAQPAE
jgi:hypothetical protein